MNIPIPNNASLAIIKYNSKYSSKPIFVEQSSLFLRTFFASSKFPLYRVNSFGHLDQLHNYYSKHSIYLNELRVISFYFWSNVSVPVSSVLTLSLSKFDDAIENLITWAKVCCICCISFFNLIFIISVARLILSLTTSCMSVFFQLVCVVLNLLANFSSEDSNITSQGSRHEFLPAFFYCCYTVPSVMICESMSSLHSRFVLFLQLLLLAVILLKYFQETSPGQIRYLSTLVIISSSLMEHPVYTECLYIFVSFF